MGVQAQVRTAPSLCPHCGYYLDDEFNSDTGSRAKPEPGDFCLCLRCCGLMVYGPALERRKGTPEDEAALTAGERATIARCRVAHAQMVAMVGRPKLDKGGNT